MPILIGCEEVIIGCGKDLRTRVRDPSAKEKDAEPHVECAHRTTEAAGARRAHEIFPHTSRVLLGECVWGFDRRHAVCAPSRVCGVDGRSCQITQTLTVTHTPATGKQKLSRQPSLLVDPA